MLKFVARQKELCVHILTILLNTLNPVTRAFNLSDSLFVGRVGVGVVTGRAKRPWRETTMMATDSISLLTEVFAIVKLELITIRKSISFN